MVDWLQGQIISSAIRALIFGGVARVMVLRAASFVEILFMSLDPVG